MGDPRDGECAECGLKKNAHTIDCVTGAFELTRGLIPDALMADVLATYPDQRDPVVLQLAQLLRDRRDSSSPGDH
jgi:hypothetical protein